MRIKDKFEVGQIVQDILGNYRCIVRSVNKDGILLSRLERPDVTYTQVPRYLKV